MQTFSKAPNVIVLVSDTFRRDLLEAYGGDGSVAPNLDRFASESWVFDHFYAASFPTVPARADLMTGAATFVQQGWEPLLTRWPTMSQRAREAGYHTIGISDVPFLMRSGYAYDRGFDDFIWIRGQLDHNSPESWRDVTQRRRSEIDHFAPQTLSAAADWLERETQRGADRPFLLYVDTWDPHEPFDPPLHYLRRHLPSYAGEPIPFPAYQYMSVAGVAEQELALAFAAYKGKASMVDFWLGFLLGRLDALGLSEDTIVFFLSDHGFLFGEHGCFGKAIRHSRDAPEVGKGLDGLIARSPLYEELAHVPLLVRIPGVPGGRVEGIVTMPDVTATVLSLVGAEPPAADSRSFISPELLPRATREFAVTSWPLHLPGDLTKAIDSLDRKVVDFMPITVSTTEWSLLYSSNDGPVELFRLTDDPGQLVDVAAQHPEVVAGLHDELVRFLAAADCPPDYLEARRSVAGQVEHRGAVR